ncbi:MAG: hypothetical protein JXQ83_09865 [Candidatus Glassbacteria bacterium]|nr:hypothetical protein [Candidatus Glassbacteria bacterium]
MNRSLSSRLRLWLVLLLLSAPGCSEQTENDLGVIMLPADAVGELPVRLEMREALEGVTVQGQPAGKGTRSLVYVGRTKQYRLRTVLSFILDLPTDIELVSASLQFYVVSTGGDPPITLAVHKLATDFTEEEVTWEQAAAGQPWATPGGDYDSDMLGSATYQGGELDTVSVNLNLKALQAHLDGPNRSRLPLVVRNQKNDVFVRLLAREIAPAQAVASRLSVIYREAGSTQQYLLERRAYQDATIASYDGQLDADRLVVGEIPASQVFFSYDLGGLPDDATVNQALLHLSVSGGAVVDSFLISAFAANEARFVGPETELTTVAGRTATESDSVFVLDITSTVQLMVLQRYYGTEPKYLGLASYRSGVTAGFMEFYPQSSPESLLRPYLILVYSKPMQAPLPD